MMASTGGQGRTASFAEVAGVVEQLRDEVAGLRADLVPRDELRTARRRAAAIVLAAALVTMTAENTAISGCFLAQPKAGSATRQVCSGVFPVLYAPAMRQGDEQRAQFRSLLATIPANTERSRANEAELRTLRERVAELERRVRR